MTSTSATIIRTAAVVEPPSQRPARVRAATSNGGLPGGVSACSAEGRRFNDVVHDLTDELGGALTSSELLQARTIAGLIVHAERLQAAELRGEKVDSEQFTRVSNSAARQIAGLRRSRVARKARPTTSPLAAYLAERAGA